MDSKFFKYLTQSDLDDILDSEEDISNQYIKILSLRLAIIEHIIDIMTEIAKDSCTLPKKFEVKDFKTKFDDEEFEDIETWFNECGYNIFKREFYIDSDNKSKISSLEIDYK